MMVGPGLNCFGSVRSSFVTLLSAQCAFSQGSNFTVGNQNGSFRRKYAFPVPFGGRNGASWRKMVGEKFGKGDRSLTDR